MIQWCNCLQSGRKWPQATIHQGLQVSVAGAGPAHPYQHGNPERFTTELIAERVTVGAAWPSSSAGPGLLAWREPQLSEALYQLGRHFQPEVTADLHHKVAIREFGIPVSKTEKGIVLSVSATCRVRPFGFKSR